MEAKYRVQRWRGDDTTRAVAMHWKSEERLNTGDGAALWSTVVHRGELRRGCYEWKRNAAGYEWDGYDTDMRSSAEALVSKERLRMSTDEKGKAWCRIGIAEKSSAAERI